MKKNNVQFAGNAGKDAELRRTQSGKAVTGFSLCHTQKKGEQEYSTWIQVNVWGDWLAEYAANVKKGDNVYVEGPLSLREWEDSEGAKRLSVEVNAFSVIIGKKFQQTAGNGYGNTQGAPDLPSNIDEIPF